MASHQRSSAPSEARAAAVSGLAMQHVAPYIASLDVSLKGCGDGRFNTRYSGLLTASDSANEAKLRLVGLGALDRQGARPSNVLRKQAPC